MNDSLGLAQMEEAFGAQDVTSGAMRRAMEEWFRLYFCPEAEPGFDYSLQLPYTLVRKLTRAVFSEFTAQGQTEFDRAVLAGLDKCRENAVEQALIGGECYLLPDTDGEGWRFRVLSRRDVLVFGRDEDGEVTDVGLVRRSVCGRAYYTLLERRILRGRRLTIENRLFRSALPGLLGREVPLGSHREYASLERKFVFPMDMESVGLVRLKNPAVNCIDGSHDGVSVFAPAVGLIKSLARNEALLSGEFERGQSRIVVSADMLRDGKLKDNVFVGLDDAPGNVGVTVFAPELREGSYLARKQAMLRDVENVMGLKRGLLSNVDELQRTATEITSSQGEYALTILDFQRMFQRAVHDAVALCRVLGEFYGMDCGEGGGVTLHFGDGSLGN